MFDDLKQQNNQSGPMSPSQAMPPQTPPPNTPPQPISDMFADIDPITQNNQAPNIKPSAVQSGKIKPVSNTAYTPGQQSGPLDPAMFSETSGNKLNKLIIILVVVLLVLALGAGAYYMIVVKGKDNSSNTNNENQNVNVNVNNNENTNEADLTDLDSDGLTDEEEGLLNTNPLLPDTDGDGLSDRDEVRTYKTDPLVLDTDNDGLNDGDEINIWDTNPISQDSDNDSYPDGTEVKNGYNPNGPGKLATSTPKVTNNDISDPKLLAAVNWGLDTAQFITQCYAVSKSAELTNYVAGADMCNPKINTNWSVPPDSYSKVCVLDKTIQDNTWLIGLQSNSPDTLSSIICNQYGCELAGKADYPNGRVCP